MRRMLKKLGLSAILFAGVVGSAFAGQVGNVVPLHNGTNWTYGYYTYLPPGGVMNDGDYMLAEQHPDNGNPTEVVFNGGDLQVWFYYNNTLQCDPTGGCYPHWVMQAHTNTYGQGYLWNDGGILKIVIGNNIAWQQGASGANLFAYQQETGQGCRGYATDFQTFTLAGPPNYC